MGADNMGKILLSPEFMKTKEWEEYGCDYLDTECYHSFSGYGMGLKKGAPEWLIKAVKDHAKKLRKIDAEEKRTGKSII